MAKSLKSSFRPSVESLESRTALTTASLAGSTLYVYGSYGNDNIQVSLNAQGQVTVSGVSGTFSAAQITAISVSSGVGNDLVNISNALTAKATVYGGEGNDTIYGGGGHDRLYGQGGADMVYGQNGNDHLSGGPSTDYLDGGAGWDSGYDAAASVWISVESITIG